MRYFIILFLMFALAACNPKAKDLSAQEIIDKTMLNSGSDQLKNSKIEFAFRDKMYRATRKAGHFELARIFELNADRYTDVLANDGFKRLINNQVMSLPDSTAATLASAVNSVHYFSVLPFGLNDAAVKKKLLTESSIHGTKYYKVQISFSEDGGGEDFEDVFVYWIHKENFTIAYMAYSFHVNEGGVRFRAAKNERIINGIRFVDYDNYQQKNALYTLENLDKAFENGELEKISEINLETIQVAFLE